MEHSELRELQRRREEQQRLARLQDQEQIEREQQQQQQQPRQEQTQASEVEENDQYDEDDISEAELERYRKIIAAREEAKRKRLEDVRERLEQLYRKGTLGKNNEEDNNDPDDHSK